MPYDPATYCGSAPHYMAGRPPYSPAMEETLAGAVDLDGRGRLLDAGCGPGILALRLAHLFEEAVGLDPDPDMLEQARRRAREQEASNVRWVQALAEDLPTAAPGPYRLVAFGQSFHRTDEHDVAEVVYDMLEPGGALALVVHSRPGPASANRPRCGPRASPTCAGLRQRPFGLLLHGHVRSPPVLGPGRRIRVRRSSPPAPALAGGPLLGLAGRHRHRPGSPPTRLRAAG